MMTWQDYHEEREGMRFIMMKLWGCLAHGTYVKVSGTLVPN